MFVFLIIAMCDVHIQKAYNSSEDSDSPAVYGDLFPSSGVPSGIVL